MGRLRQERRALDKSSRKNRRRLPIAAAHVAFHRQIGEFRDVHATPDGDLIDSQAWKHRSDHWLPSQADGNFIADSMKPTREPGQFAELDRAAQSRDRTTSRAFRVCEDWRREL